MKVLIVTHSFVVRDVRIRRQVETFRDAGWEVEVLALDAPRREEGVRSWRVPMERRRGSPARYVWEYGVFFLATLLWVASRSWRRSRPDLVYVNSLPDFLVFAGWPARLRGIPVVLDVHDPMPELFAAKGRRSALVRRLLEAQERRSVRFADGVITVHEPMWELLASRSPGVPIDVVMNVPDTSGWVPPRRDATSRTVVFAGSIAVRYGLDDLVAAMAQVADRIPGLRLRLLGEGEDLGRLRDLARRAGIGDRIEYRGTVPWEEVRSHYADAWVGFNGPKPSPAGNLSFSNKVVEWVALGMPVVASRIPTLLRYFPEDALWYFDAGSVDALAATLLELHRAPAEVVAARSERARAALEEIAWPVQRAALLAVAERLVAGR